MQTIADMVAAADRLSPVELGRLREAIDRLEKERRALVLHPKGKRYRLMRLDDAEYFELHRRSIAIKDDASFLVRYFLALHQDQDELGLAQAYLALTEFTGPSGRYFDDYKCSFSFPFLLDGSKVPSDRPYLLEVRDFRGSLEFPVRKIVDADDPRQPEGRIHAPFADELSREEINELIVYVHSYLTGYWQAVQERWHEPFLNRVRSNSILYGYCGGNCFEEHHDSERSYEAAIRRYERRIKREPKRGHERPAARRGK